MLSQKWLPRNSPEKEQSITRGNALGKGSRTRRDDQEIVAPSAITEDDIQAGAVRFLKKILLPEGQQ
jgi:hypothetical protein